MRQGPVKVAAGDGQALSEGVLFERGYDFSSGGGRIAARFFGLAWSRCVPLHAGIPRARLAVLAGMPIDGFYSRSILSTLPALAAKSRRAALMLVLPIMRNRLIAKFRRHASVRGALAVRERQRSSS